MKGAGSIIGIVGICVSGYEGMLWEKGDRMTEDDLGKLMAATAMAEGHRNQMPTTHKKPPQSGKSEELSANPRLSHKLNPGKHTKYER